MEKLKQLLACVVDKIVVVGRDHIQPYLFVPGVSYSVPFAEAEGTCKNPIAAGQAVWVDAWQWGSVEMTARD